ncbi:hypothetical protein SAY87_019835 [Trapa incisa]|uniref:Uncharacterized protein n=1 Tax=Trapa incisa TaxID=236973 RepID=A0AAN7K525_9MYRT|nr:hypothetical protein SAY87_019835 [Trapa incisa]
MNCMQTTLLSGSNLINGGSVEERRYARLIKVKALEESNVPIWYSSTHISMYRIVNHNSYTIFHVEMLRFFYRELAHQGVGWSALMKNCSNLINGGSVEEW